MLKKIYIVLFLLVFVFSQTIQSEGRYRYMLYIMSQRLDLVGWFGLSDLTPLNLQYFSYVIAVSFIGG